MEFDELSRKTLEKQVVVHTHALVWRVRGRGSNSSGNRARRQPCGLLPVASSERATELSRSSCSSPSFWTSCCSPLSRPFRHRSGLLRGRAWLLLPASFWTMFFVVLSCLVRPAIGLVIEEPFQASFDHMAAAFGPDVLKMDPPIESRPLVKARPRDACTSLYNSIDEGAVALVERGTCNFTQKVWNAQAAGAAAVVVTDTRSTEKRLMIMYGAPESTDGIEIPAVLVSHATGERLWNSRSWLPSGRLRASVNATGHIMLQAQSVGTLEMLGIYVLLSVLLVAFSGACGLLFALMFTWYQRGYRTRAMRRLKSFAFSRRTLTAFRATRTDADHTAGSSDTATNGEGSAAAHTPSWGGGVNSPRADSTRQDAGGSEAVREGTGGRGAVDHNGMRAEDDMCAICLDAYEEGESLTGLPCRHSFHTHCIRPWLSGKSGLCPMCKSEAFAGRGLFLATTPRLEAAFAELAALCTENLVVLGVFFLASVACGVIAGKLSLGD